MLAITYNLGTGNAVGDKATANLCKSVIKYEYVVRHSCQSVASFVVTQRLLSSFFSARTDHRLDKTASV